MGVHQITSRPETGPFGVLRALSPELARDLGQAFSLERIGTRRPTPAEPGVAGRGALRVASFVAAFLLVATVAVSSAITALYFLQLP